MHRFLNAIAGLIAPLVFLVAPPAAAQEDAEDAKPTDFVAYPEAPSVTYHAVDIGGATIHYQATAGTLVLPKGKDNKPGARIFYIAYRKTEGAVAW